MNYFENKIKFVLGFYFLINSALLFSQTEFNYHITVEPTSISGLDGLHSYALGQHDGKSLFIGGRRDGVHARQPFNAFPESENNTTIYVVDFETQEVWTASILSLPTGLKEQLQSTNMEFFQDGSTLFFLGGYGFSNSVGDHITFPNLTSIDIPGLIDDVISGSDISSNFEQISSDNFAVTGGNMGKIGDEFLLVGGHRFDGRYNPMNHPTFTQEYSNQIRKFKLDTSNGLSFSEYSSVTDEINLHRRDYDLVPQIFPDGSFGYTIFSGVFQINLDLPFLYPVDIYSDGHVPVSNFNQMLSHYHSANIPLYDNSTQAMHTLFFGGMSQYYFDNNGTLVQDDYVPFVKTISRVSRNADNGLEEVAFSNKMPTYVGAGAEFILNEDLPILEEGIINLNELQGDSVLLGYIFGGIESPALNPFTFNNTEVTFASNTIFKIYLVADEVSAITNTVVGYHSFDIESIPNPTEDTVIHLKMNLPEPGNIDILLANIEGKLILNETIENIGEGENLLELPVPDNQTGLYFLTVVLNGKYYATEKISVQE
jgi:hypothetical protein